MEIEINQLPRILKVKVNKSLLEKHKPNLKHLFTEPVFVGGREHSNLIRAEFPRERFAEAFALYEEVRGVCAGSRNWIL